jgi:phage-related protein
MPRTETVFFAADAGTAPVLEWLDDLPRKVQDKCIVRVERLREAGYELRRPEADVLRDGIHELRIRHRREHFRLLYGFHKRTAVLLAGVKKEGAVPDRAIDMAVERLREFSLDPERHTYRG